MNNGLSMVGIATKAGKTVSGEFATEKSIKEGKAKVVIVAKDASDNTKKLFQNKCDYYCVPVFVTGTKDELGMVTGNQSRASLAVVDSGFAKVIVEKLKVQEL